MLIDKKYDEWNAINKEDILKIVNSKHSIYLHSQYGMGKTHFLYWLAKKYQYQGFSVYLRFMSDLNRDLKKEIGDRQNGIVNKSIDTKMRECYVLCLDDVGNEYMTAFTHEVLSGVINYRYEKKLPTFITSNYNPKQLKDIYAKAIGEVKAAQLISRLMTFGAIELKADNYRAKYEY